MTGFSLFRSGAAITSVATLSSLRSGITAAPFTDANPTSAQTWYAVVAFDASGNVSPASNSERMNVDLLPVSGLTLTWNTTGGTPVLTWPARSGTVAGYTVRLFPNESSATALDTQEISGASSTSFNDSTFSGTPPRTYSVASRDAANAESLQRKVTLPDATFAHHPAEGTTPRLLKGVLNRVPFRITAGTVPLSHAKVELTLAGNVSAAPWHSEEFDLAAGDTRDVTVAVPGDDTLPDTTASLSAALLVCPYENECVSMTSVLSLPVEALALQVSLQPAGFTKGGNGRVRFTAVNPSTDPLELLCARRSGADPSPDLQFILQDRDGNILTTQKVKIATGAHVFQLPNADTVIRIGAGETYTSAELTLPVPVNAPSDLLLFFQGERTWYHHSQPDELAIEAGFRVGTSVNAAATTYSAALTSATVDPADPRHVSLVGSATYNSSTSTTPVAMQSVIVKVARGAADFTATVLTKTDGTFVYEYQHPTSEPGGLFSAWAMHPERTDRDTQVTFSVLGLQTSPSSFRFSAPRDYELPLSLRVTAASGTSVSGLHLELNAIDQSTAVGAAGLTGLTLTCPSVTVAGGASANLSVEFRGNSTAAASGSLIARLVGTAAGESTARVWQLVELTYSLGEGRPSLTAAPRLLQTGVNPGQEVLETVVFENNGYASLVAPSWRLVTSSGGAAPAWAQVLTEPAGAESSLEVGQKQSVQLRFAPPASEPAALHQFRLRMSGANYAAVDYTILVEITEGGAGTLAVQVIDAFSPSDGSGGFTKGVANAVVRYSNEDVATIFGTATVAADAPQGMVTFADLPAGRYQLRVNGPNHDTLIRRIRVQPGVTTTEQVQLRYEGVKVNWSVTEKTIKDTYDVKASLLFETNLPVANVISDPPSIVLPSLKKGEVFGGEFVLTNVGGVRADQVKVNLPAPSATLRCELQSSVPSSLLPGEQVRVSWTALALSDFVPPTVASVGDSLLEKALADAKKQREEFSPLLLRQLYGDSASLGSNASRYLRSSAAAGNGSITEGLMASGSGGGSDTPPGGECLGLVPFSVPYHYKCSNGTEFDGLYTIHLVQPVPCRGGGGGGGIGGTGRGSSPGGGFGNYTPPGSSLPEGDGVFCWPDSVLPNPCDDDVPGSPQRQPTHSWVDLLNRLYQDRTVDMSFNTSAGPLEIVRVWTGRSWSWNITKKIETYSFDGKIYAIVRQGMVYSPVKSQATPEPIITKSTTGFIGSIISSESSNSSGGSSYTSFMPSSWGGATTASESEWAVGQLKIRTHEGGYRWESPTGEWEDYNFWGQMTARGYLKRTLMTCRYADREDLFTRGAPLIIRSISSSSGGGGGSSTISYGGGGSSSSSSNGVPGPQEAPVEIKDEYGTTVFSIESIGPTHRRVTKITDRAGRQLIYDWNEWRMNSATLRDADDHLVWRQSYQYNEAGQITSKIDADGIETRMTYDPPKDPASLLLAARSVSSSRSSGGGSGGVSVSVGIPMGIGFRADPVPGKIGGAIRTVEGLPTGDQRYSFEKQGVTLAVPTATVGPLLKMGSSVSTTTSTSSSSTGSVTMLAPSGLTFPTSISADDGTYAKVSFAGGAVNEFWFDKDGKLIRREENGLPVTTVLDNGSTRTSVSELGAATISHIGTGGKVTEVVYPDGSSVSTGFDPAFGKPTRFVDRRGAVTEFEYDADGQPIVLREAAGTTAERERHLTYYYDEDDGAQPEGQIKTVTDANGHTLKFEYTTSAHSDQPRGLVRRIVDLSDGNFTINFTYDDRGNLIQSQQTNGLTDRWAYDDANRVIIHENAEHEATVYTYLGGATLIEQIETGAIVNGAMHVVQHGRCKRWHYDDRGRIDRMSRAASPSAADSLIEAYEYDEGGHLLTKINALGQVTERHTYDKRGRLTSTTVPHPTLGTVTSQWLYNGNGQATELIAPDGTRTTYTYDSIGRLSSTTEAVGDSIARTIQKTYNGAGDLVGTVYVGAGAGGGNLTTSYGYDVLGRHVGTSGARTFAQGLEYNSVGDLIATTDALGSRRRFDFDVHHLMTARWEPAVAAADNGGVAQPETATRYYYDTRGKLIASLNANGIWQFTVFDDLGRPTYLSLPTTDDLRGTNWTADSARIERRFTYDRFGDVSASYFSGEGTTTFTRDGFGRVVAKTLATGWSEHYTYDGLDRLVKVTRDPILPEADGGTGSEAHSSVTTTIWSPSCAGCALTTIEDTGDRTSYTYDSNFRLKTTTTASGASTTNTYDALGRVTTETVTPAETDLSPRVARYTYDAFDQVLRSEREDHQSGAAEGSPNARVETWFYDERGLVLSHAGPDSDTASFEFDAAGHNTAAIDGAGRRTRFDYDARGRLVRKVFADGSSESWRYDAGGRLQQHGLPGGLTKTYSYDHFDNVTQIDYPVDPSISVSHDALGRQTAVARVLPSGARTGEVQFTYDAFGRLATETQVEVGRTLALGWTPSGRRSSTTIHRGDINGPVERTIAHHFDHTGRVLSINDSSLGAGAGQFNYTYDDGNGAGGVSSLTMPAGQQSQRIFNSLGQLNSLEWIDAQSNSLARFSVTRSASGQLVDQRSAIRGFGDISHSYGYDQRRRLTAATGTAATPVPGSSSSAPGSGSWAWDTAGNPTTRTLDSVSTSFASNSLNQLSAINGSAAVHSAEGNLTLYAPPWQPGASGPPGITTMTYDQEQRLLQITSAATSRITRYAYDATGRRISASHEQTGLATTQTRFLYDAGSTRPLAELDALGNTLRTFVWGLDIVGSMEGTDGIGALLAVHDVSAETTNDVTQGDRCILTDLQGNVTALITSNSTLLAAWRYDPFGNEVASTGAPSALAACPFRHATRWADAWAGPTLLAYAARWYAPTLGRWLTRDPAGELGGLNLYDFTRGNAPNAVDIRGNWVHIVGGAVIGAGVGAALAWWHGGSARDIWIAAFKGGTAGAVAALFPGSLLGMAGGGAAGSVLADLLGNALIDGECLSLVDILQNAAKAALMAAGIGAALKALAPLIKRLPNPFRKGAGEPPVTEPPTSPRGPNEPPPPRNPRDPPPPHPTEPPPSPTDPPPSPEPKLTEPTPPNNGPGAANIPPQGPVIIGETMARVEAAASKIPGAKILNDMPDFRAMGMNPDQVTSAMMQYNRQWLLDQMRSGRPIINIGADANRATPSIFYRMEQNMLNNYQKLHPGSLNITTP